LRIGYRKKVIEIEIMIERVCKLLKRGGNEEETIAQREK
jgi:hypothetical protein